MGPLAAVLAADPLGVAGPRRDLAVEGHGRLEQDPRPSHAGMLAKRLVEQAGPPSQLSLRDDDLDALVAEDPEAASGRLLGGIVRGDDDPLDAGLQDGIGARRGLALVAARLERDVERRVGEIGEAARLDRVDLGVRTTVFGMPALAEDLAVACHDRADDGVGPHGSAVAGELDGPGEVRLVGVGAVRHRSTQDNPATSASAGGRRPAIRRSARRGGGRRSSAARAGDRRAGSSRSSSRS